MRKDNAIFNLGLFLFSLLVVVVIYMIFYKLFNPDMTDTRIFLNRWYIIAPGFACGTIGVFLLENCRKL
jgi:hypothetical protein